MVGLSAARAWHRRLIDWLVDRRNRLLASPGFQSFAARNPVTRLVARDRAGALFSIATGFAHARTLYACVELGVFTSLANGPRTVPDMAVALDLPPDACRTLLKAASAIGLLQLAGPDRFALGELGASVLGNPGLEGMICHHSVLYRDLVDPVALLRRPRGTAELSTHWPYARATPDQVESTWLEQQLLQQTSGAQLRSGRIETRSMGGASDPEAAASYSRLMGETQAMIAGHILDAVDLGQARMLMDLGGGNGAFLAAALARNSGLRGHLVDLPDVAALGAALFQAAGLSGRTQVTPASFLTDALPSGADVISFVRVLHDHDDPAVMTALRAARAALKPGGRLVIAEPMAATPGAAAMGDGYFGLYLYAMGTGRPRTAAELSAMAASAGFSAVRERPTAIPLLVRVLVAEG